MRKKSSLLNSVISLGLVSFSILRRGFSKLSSNSKAGQLPKTSRVEYQERGEQPSEVGAPPQNEHMSASTSDSESDHIRSNSNTKKKEDRNWLAGQTILQGVLTLLTAATLVFLLWHAIIFTRQQVAMKGQLETMQRQLETMQNQAKNMEEQTNMMNDSLKQTHKIVEQNERAVTASEIQAKASQQSVKASQQSVAAALRSANAAEQSMMVGNTAFLVVKGANFDRFYLGGSPVVSIFFTNSGNTPALNVKLFGGIGLRDRPVFERMPSEPDITPNSAPFGYLNAIEQTVTTIGPKIDLTGLIISRFVIDQQSMSLLSQRKLRLYAWGSAEYDDIWGYHHTTEFCYGLTSGENLTPCGSNNNMR
jgi:hypothetical protein